MVRSSSCSDHSYVVPALASEAVSDRPRESAVGEWAVSLEDVLETVEEFGSASLDLIAWEFSVPVAELAELWDQAVGAGLLRLAGSRDGAGEQMYARATPGHVAQRTSAYRTA
jgi:hypothetical protein